MSLPVEEILPRLRQTLPRKHAVLSSPPGSGKTTRVPLALLNEPWLQGKKILMLEPRRPAARMAAAFMADLMNEEVGASVGYQVRMDRRIGKHTRIEVLTEGLLVRRLQDDPELSDVGLVIFDEFHERSLQADLALALCLDVCASLREDLRLLIMSATLDEQAVANLIGGTVITSDGGLYSVHIEHLARPAGRDVLQATARLVYRALEEQEGDVLVFLPGKGEIQRLQESLLGMQIAAEVLQLHGEMDAATQGRVLRPAPNHPRRVVLATDVAETSLTIEGIRTVVDSGLSRKPVFDPDSGLSRLKVQPVAQASAIQRAGRAGRLGPGTCYRAYTEQEFRSRPVQRPAEILQADLASLVLELAGWGVKNAADLSWLDRPPVAAWNQAVDLLRMLDALDEAGHITAQGRQMTRLGLHPRLAQLLVCGGSGNLRAADLAALLSERDPWRYRQGVPRPADLYLRLRALDVLRQGGKVPADFDAGACRQILRLGDRLLRQGKGMQQAKETCSAAALLSLAFPDRVAQRRPGSEGRYLMASGKGAVLPRDDSLATAPYLAIAQMDAGSREGRIWLALELDEGELQAVHARHIQENTELGWDARTERVSKRVISTLGALQLTVQEVPVDSNDPAVTKILLQAILEKGLDCLNWSDEARQLQARLQLARQLDDQSDWPEVNPEWLTRHLETWLGPWIEGLRSLKEVRRIDLVPVLRGMMSWEQGQRLDELLPGRWKLGDGSTAAIDYQTSPPVLAAPLQLMYGMARTPAVFHGRLPLVLHLLSPAGRPLQVTTDLAAFWAGAWEQVKKEMRGRYPKHQWPDDPATARPVRLKRHL
ncbi:ATP-dependent helicase HrpB [Thiolapillus brandeum]|nr:ATP-dependent helicase HrpB [Thiolapillus brandeum]